MSTSLPKILTECLLCSSADGNAIEHERQVNRDCSAISAGPAVMLAIVISFFESKEMVKVKARGR